MTSKIEKNFTKYCRLGDFESLKNLVHRHKQSIIDELTNIDDQFITLCEHGKLPIVKFIYKHFNSEFGFNKLIGLYKAYKNGNLEIAKYIISLVINDIKNNNIIYDDYMEICSICCKYGILKDIYVNLEK
jgi:hypothetical protein